MLSTTQIVVLWISANALQKTEAIQYLVILPSGSSIIHTLNN